MTKEKQPTFSSEAEMCGQFLSVIPDEWTAYPETGGFDILLVRKEDGAQVGVEAKLKLNAKVISQAAQQIGVYKNTYPGPDFRAVLVPYNTGWDLIDVCRLLSIEVIRIYPIDHSQSQRYIKGKIVGKSHFLPDLPSLKYNHNEMCGEQWFDFCPEKRIKLPDFVPDCGAGNKSPIQLSTWKIKAIKIVIEAMRRGFVTRQDFKYHSIDMSRWTQCGWIVSGKNKSEWILSEKVPDFRKQHPVNFAEIENVYNDWKHKRI